jgi:ParB family chromosome partitioning protein
MRHDSHYVDELTKSHQFIGRTIQLSKIEPNPEQPRVEMGDLSELVASIREKGVLEPLLVKPLTGLDRWLIIAGERRWRAAQLAGLTELPCIELDIDEREIAEIALIENLQRKDLTIWEEADAYQALIDRFNYTHEDMAKKLGKSRSSVTETLTIASLPSLVRQKCIESGIFSKSTILKIARKFDENEMLQEIRKSGGQDVAPGRAAFQKHPEVAQEKLLRKTDLDFNREDELASHLNGSRNLTFPLKIFKFSDENHKFKVELKFKKPATLDEIKKAVSMVMESLSNQNE